MRKAEVIPVQFQTVPFTVNEAISQGVSAHRLRSRDLYAPFVGVRAFENPITRKDRACALGLRLREGQAISGLAAAELWGLRVPDNVQQNSAEVEVLTRATASRVRIEGIVSRSIRDDLFRASYLGRVPIVSPVLAVLTSAAYLSESDVTVMLDALLTGSNVYRDLNFPERPHITELQLPAMLHRFQRMKGIETLRGAVEMARPGVESPMESVLRLKMIEYGLPEPQIQPVIRLPNGETYRPDLGYPGANTYVNYDGEFHARDQATIDKDALQNRHFQEFDVRLIRVIKTDLNGQRWNGLVRNIELSILRG